MCDSTPPRYSFKHLASQCGLRPGRFSWAVLDSGEDDGAIVLILQVVPHLDVDCSELLHFKVANSDGNVYTIRLDQFIVDHSTFSVEVYGDELVSWLTKIALTQFDAVVSWHDSQDRANVEIEALLARIKTLERDLAAYDLEKRTERKPSVS